ncbi:MAG: alkaline phosphatase D family protein [Actinomycetota bacterium]
MDDAGPRLLLGPLLRYVDDTCATVWVETDRPCDVQVLSARSRTWTVHGHHYALVVVRDLQPGTETPYEVHLDGVRVWPETPNPFPPSMIRTFRHDESFRLAFGSCRRSAPYDEKGLRKVGADALVALASRMTAVPTSDWPDALLMVGDQVYADEPSDAMAERLAGPEVSNFEEYTWLYHEAWSVPEVRWLLSTVPTCMLLDDHDLRDDWNTSLAWRRQVTAQPWWRDRVVGAFASYWVYQHLGNMSPDELAVDDVLAALRSAPDDEERSRRLDEFAWRSDAESEGGRWSFFRDFGDARLGVRLVAVDSRCSRVLDDDRRAMLDDAEWQWVVEHALHAREGQRIDHLLVASTLPFLLLRGIHHLEGWSEAIATAGAWGRVGRWLGEHLRQAVDLEHWAAFRRSFDRVVHLLEQLVTSQPPPVSVLMLSGDVHCSYTAEARLTNVDHGGTALHQLTMSPFRNPLHQPLEAANRAFAWRPVRAFFHGLARRAGVRDPTIDWDVDHGPWFGNGVMTVVIQGRQAWVEVDHAEVAGGRQVLTRTLSARLTRPPTPQ